MDAGSFLAFTLAGFLVSPVAQELVPLDAGPVVEVAPAPPNSRAQSHPDLAFDEVGTFLVVWQQGATFFESEDARVLAARIASDGRILDPKPIALGTVGGSQERPRVRFSNGVFLVVWQELRDGREWDVRGARVRPDGVVLDPAGIDIAVAPGAQALPDVAPGPDGFVVVWQDFRNGRWYELYAARIGVDGRIRDPKGVGLRHAARSLEGGTVSVANAGDIWFLSWSDERDLSSGGVGKGQWRFARVDRGLIVLDVAFAPNKLIGWSGGRMFGFGPRACYAYTFMLAPLGRSAAGAVLFDSTSVNALPSPNQDEDASLASSGWNTKEMVVLRPTRLGAQGPVSVGYDGKRCVALVRGVELPGRGPGLGRQILAMRLAPDGRRIDRPDSWTVIHDGVLPASDPVTAGGKEGSFLAVYAQDGGPGKRRLIARLLTVK